MVEIVVQVETVIGTDRDEVQRPDPEFAPDIAAAALIFGARVVIVADRLVLRPDHDAREHDRWGQPGGATQPGILTKCQEGPTDRGVAVDVIARDDERGRIGRLPAQLAAQVQRLAAIDPLPVEQVADIAVPVVVSGRHDIAELLVDRAGDAEIDALLAIGRRDRIGADAQFRGRVAGDQIDQTGRGRLAVERALGAAQHLDPLDVGQIGEGARLEGQRHFVDQHGNARLDADTEGEGADAAQRDVGVLRLLGRADDQRGRDLADIGEVADTCRRQLGRGDDRDGEWDALDILGALVGGDDDVACTGRFGCDIGRRAAGLPLRLLGQLRLIGWRRCRLLSRNLGGRGQRYDHRRQGHGGTQHLHPSLPLPPVLAGLALSTKHTEWPYQCNAVVRPARGRMPPLLEHGEELQTCATFAHHRPAPDTQKRPAKAGRFRLFDGDVRRSGEGLVVHHARPA